MQRASTLFALAVLASSLTACAGNGSSGAGIMPLAHQRQGADTTGGGPVFSAAPPPGQIKPKDTTGGGPVFTTPQGNQAKLKPKDTTGGGPVFTTPPGN